MEPISVTDSVPNKRKLPDNYCDGGEVRKEPS